MYKYINCVLSLKSDSDNDLPHQIDGDTNKSDENTANSNHRQHPMIQMRVF